MKRSFANLNLEILLIRPQFIHILERESDQSSTAEKRPPKEGNAKVDHLAQIQILVVDDAKTHLRATVPRTLRCPNQIMWI